MIALLDDYLRIKVMFEGCFLSLYIHYNENFKFNPKPLIGTFFILFPMISIKTSLMVLLNLRLIIRTIIMARFIFMVTLIFAVIQYLI